MDGIVGGVRVTGGPFLVFFSSVCCRCKFNITIVNKLLHIRSKG